MPYDFDGNAYANVSTMQKSVGRSVIETLNLKGNEHILDLGCGDGGLTLELAAKVPNGQVTAIDASDGMLAAAKNHTVENITFQKMDINHLELSDTFDLIFSNAALHWIKDHQHLYRQLWPLLNPQGKIRINMASTNNCPNFLKAVRDTMQNPDYQDCFRDFEWPWYMPSLKDYTTLLNEFPFRELDIWEEPIDWHFPDKQALAGWASHPGIVPFLPFLPEEQREPFKNMAITSMQALTRTDNGAFVEQFSRINVRAVK